MTKEKSGDGPALPAIHFHFSPLKRPLRESNPQLELRSKAPRTLLLVMFSHIEFLKSLDLRGFLAIAGTLLFVLVWSLFDPVLAYFVCKMLA